MRTPVPRISLVLFTIGLVGCDSGLVEPIEPLQPPPAADASLGRAAFANECAICHAPVDGFDLAFFSFSDTTIIRRAVAHVDTLTARNIVAHIRSLDVRAVTRDVRPFQPGVAVLGTDVEFAHRLFGRDSWPTDLTTAGLLAIDPRNVSIAVELPRWSDEETNLDWMPGDPLPEGILGFRGSMAAAAIAGYRAAPTGENLARAVNALRTADRNVENLGAPCLFEDPVRVDFRACFEVRRWTSALVAQHMLRYGPLAGSMGAIHDAWWDVGNAARKSRTVDAAAEVDNAVQNWATWMYLGWSFDPSRHPSAYTGGGFLQLGLPRHATFIALRSEVARPRNSPSVFDDARQAIRFAPAGWGVDVATFAYRHLLERLASGDRPTRPEQLTMAADAIRMSMTDVSRKVPVARRAEVLALAEQVLQAIAAP